MAMKRRSTKRKSMMLPSWNEVRVGLSLLSRLRLLLLLAKVYKSAIVPRAVKVSILSMARMGARKIKSRKSTKVRTGKRRSPAQRRATRKLVLMNKRRSR